MRVMESETRKRGSMVTLQRLDGEYAIIKFSPDSTPPEWAFQGDFSSVTRTPSELSIVCDARFAPLQAKAEIGWVVFQVMGQFGFEQYGILESLIRPLSDAGISILSISTFDTDYILVKDSQEEKARAAWTDAGYRFE
ncbi:ACT domain-containing protein [Deinococcus misasensis]|uniref:ACT domain-containing protein n=1 Tax=Deinococcus misasensis TaxID=392413 RepID=UPI0014702E20|nr:ACT domain-containing protein [Deinococcus misasensis]